MSNKTAIEKIDLAIAALNTAKKEILDTPPLAPSEGFSRAKALEIAVAHAKANHGWRSGGAAKQYTKKFEPVFGTGRYPWCASFVTWCCEQAGLNIPVNCPTGYTFALCEAWQIWAQKMGFYIANAIGVVPEPGDIVLFDWDQKYLNTPDTDWEDHIGFIIEQIDKDNYRTAEGNVNDSTAIKTRHSGLMQGFIRIPDGFKF